MEKKKCLFTALGVGLLVEKLRFISANPKKVKNILNI